MFRGITGLIGLPGMAARGFPKTLSNAEVGLTADVTCKAADFQTIGKFTVPPQQKYKFGVGGAMTPYNQGYLYVKLHDTTVEIPGKVRLTYSDANGMRRQTIYEERNEVLSASASARDQMKALVETAWKDRPDGRAGEDDKMLLEFKPDADAILSFANSTVNIPATQY